MIRIGLMGCGNIARRNHLPTLQQTPGLTVVSIFEPDPQRLEATRDQFSIAQAFTDAEAFFNSGIDAVVVTSSAPAHIDNVLMAARYRKPVLCEKPLAMNDTDARTMIDAMSDAGVPLYVGFTYRFSAAARQIHSLIRAGAIGRLLSLRLIYLWDCHGLCQPRDSDCINERRLGRMLEGGPMVDCGVHQIDLARWWTGAEVVAAQGVGAWVEDHAAPDHMYLHLDHANSAHTMVEISYSYAHTSRDTRPHFVYELIGTDGLLRYNRDARVFELLNRQGTTQLEWAPEKNFAGMYIEFERALREGTDGNMPTGEDGLIATRIARTSTEQVIARRQHQTPAHPDQSHRRPQKAAHQ